MRPLLRSARTASLHPGGPRPAAAHLRAVHRHRARVLTACQAAAAAARVARPLPRRVEVAADARAPVADPGVRHAHVCGGAGAQFEAACAQHADGTARGGPHRECAVVHQREGATAAEGWRGRRRAVLRCLCACPAAACGRAPGGCCCAPASTSPHRDENSCSVHLAGPAAGRVSVVSARRAAPFSLRAARAHGVALASARDGLVQL